MPLEWNPSLATPSALPRSNAALLPAWSGPVLPPAITLRWLPDVPDILFRAEPYRTAQQLTWIEPLLLLPPPQESWAPVLWQPQEFRIPLRLPEAVVLTAPYRAAHPATAGPSGSGLPGLQAGVLLAVSQRGGPPLLYIGRSDEPALQVLDTYTHTNVPASAVRVRTRPISGNEQPGARQKKRRFKRLNIYGEGTVTGGTITVNLDPGSGRQVVYSAVNASVTPFNDGVSDKLLIQGLEDSAVGYVIDVDLMLFGVDLTIRAVQAEYVDIDT